MDSTAAPDYKKHIETLRKNVLEDTAKLADFDEMDVTKFRTDDNYCERFLIHNQGDVDKSTAMVKESLKWRKEFGVRGIKESSIPLDMHKLENIYNYNSDKEGSPIIMMIVKDHKKDSEKVEDARRNVVYWVEKCLKDSPTQKVSVVYDCTDSGYANMDLELTMFVANLFIKFYPESLGYIIVYDMPWLFNAIWKVIKPLLPKHARHRVVFVNKTSIKEYIDDKCLPIRMGGQDSTVYQYKPSS